MREEKVFSSDCLHCVVGPLVDMVTKAGESPEKVISDLAQVLAEFIESAPSGIRERQKAFALRAFEQCCAEARKAFDTGMAANQPVAGHA